MTEDFKRRLKAYERGELEGEELEAFEKELEKLEQFQDMLETDDSDKTSGTNDQKNKKSLWKNEQKQRKILRKGKWRARIQTAFYAVVLFIAFTIVASIITSLYYSLGSNRMNVYADIIDYSLTVTDPYGIHGGSGANVTPYFSMKVNRDLRKQIGDEIIKVGEMDVNFILSLMGDPEETYIGKETQSTPAFFYPEYYDFDIGSDWDRLEKLPEGTVASAYISFAELMDTETVFDHMEDKELSLLWLAVDSGFESPEDDDFIAIHEPLGFPAHPIWHDDDFILESREENIGFLGSGTVSESYSSPDYEAGDPEPLHTQFLKTLNFLKKYERKTNKMFFGNFNLSERIDYLENNGIYHYGIVVTGPTKEVLALRDESWVKVMQIDEVDLWNWHSIKD